MKFNWRQILLHLLFWVLYVIIWGVRDMAYAPSFLDTIDSNLIGTGVYSIGVYINLYLLVPKLLIKKKRVAYISAIVPLILIIAYATAQAFAEYFKTIHLGTSEFFDSAQGIANTGGDFLVVYGFSTCLFFINEYYIKERKVRELETNNLKSELDLLKSQVNPHFMFNALNSIHVLIKKDPIRAQQTLEKFSELLSHQIYEVKKEEIALKDEIDNLDNFIEIQKLRQDSHVNVTWEVKGALTGLRIAPMLFLNFAENAFKHATSNNDKVNINIQLRIDGQVLEFLCLNTIGRPKPNVERPGVGLANVRRRLEILYPETHELHVENTENEFAVKLTLNLED